ADGTDLSSARYDGAGSFSEGRAVVIRDGQVWFIKEDGTDLFSARYDGADSFSNGRARVIKGRQWWFIDLNGNKIADT
ncbi:MAG: WG repeat-containing protein, partial [Patescibacteria group bacterium]